ncbi:probable G-protein coupled receptor 160 isoform X3 [Ailuropoda melanoleuca]|uniref:probable G-protein coupled receptor 160 isoform X3 n=1 Tax=Ailuropoda melanoleuca TaxID=9646 RepID=UPI0014946454|nr:probable G-protein coupled receptor 160 isoform X3 [Ailuropoda melanoleuca]XP_034519058.1 probable G-protein coupled receptor 160 isoform X3 [Ailuropoda melanoleuca]
MAPAHPADIGAPWGWGWGLKGWYAEGGLTQRRAAPALPVLHRLSPPRRQAAPLRPASRRGRDGACALKGCPARTPALPGGSGPNGGVPLGSQGPRLLPPPLLLGALGAEPAGRAGLPPLYRRSPGAGRSRCLVWRPEPATRSASPEPRRAGWPREVSAGPNPGIPEATARTQPAEKRPAGRKRARFAPPCANDSELSHMAFWNARYQK